MDYEKSWNLHWCHVDELSFTLIEMFHSQLFNNMFIKLSLTGKMIPVASTLTVRCVYSREGSLQSHQRLLSEMTLEELHLITYGLRYGIYLSNFHSHNWTKISIPYTNYLEKCNITHNYLGFMWHWVDGSSYGGPLSFHIFIIIIIFLCKLPLWCCVVCVYLFVWKIKTKFEGNFE